MKKIVITMFLTLVASTANASVAETAGKQLGLAMVDSLVDLQLQTACGNHIASTGKEVVTVDSSCISKVNALLTTLETEPSSTQLVKKVITFMNANSIPRNL